MKSNLFEKQFSNFLCLTPWERRPGVGTVASRAAEALCEVQAAVSAGTPRLIQLVTAVHFIRKPVSKNRCWMKLLLEHRAIWLLKGHFVLLERKYENSPFGSKS